MGWLDWTVSILTIIVGVVLTIVTMMQDSSNSSQSSITGANTFYGSNKSKTLDGVLSRWTVILAIAFIILCVLTTIAIIH